MKRLQEFRIRLSPRWTLVLSIVFLTILLWILQIRLTRSTSSLTHTLGHSTQHVDVLWSTKDDMFNLVTANPHGVAFTMPMARDSLIALDVRSGTAIWKTKLQFEHSGVKNLLTNENTVFLVTSISVDAYDSITGKLKWSRKLGEGHVSIVSQLDSDKVRVYYGDKLYEIDTKTGEILSNIPKDDIVWISNDILLRETSTNKLVAVSKRTNEVLWTNDQEPYITDDHKPRDIGEGNLVVGFVKGICRLNMQTGEYSWCRPEIDISKLAVDEQSHIGYAMRDDLVLITIDLQTGKVLGETNFLSNRAINEQIGFFSSMAFSDGVVIIAFSDSSQTFGLEFKEAK